MNNTIIPNPLQRNEFEVKHLQRKVVKEGSKYCVKSKKGKNLGCYDTKKEALERLRQVEHFKKQ